VVSINENALVIGSSEVVIRAEPRTVWQVLTDFERWPDWNPDVSSLALQGRVSVGSTFRWKTGSSTINSTIQEVDEPWRIVGRGKQAASERPTCTSWSRRTGAPSFEHRSRSKVCPPGCSEAACRRPSTRAWNPDFAS